MTNKKLPYWVSDFKEEAIEKMKNDYRARLTEDGYEEEDIEMYVEDMVNEKTANLEEIFEKEYLLELV